MEIIWTDKAIESYNAVIDYSLENFGKFATLTIWNTNMYPKKLLKVLKR